MGKSRIWMKHYFFHCQISKPKWRYTAVAARVQILNSCHKAEGPSISEQGMILFHPEWLLTKSCRDLCDNYLTQCEKIAYFSNNKQNWNGKTHVVFKSCLWGLANPVSRLDDLSGQTFFCITKDCVLSLKTQLTSATARWVAAEIRASANFSSTNTRMFLK